MNKKVFNDGLQKLLIEYEDSGFTLKKERIELWWDKLKEEKDEVFERAISVVLETCTYKPLLASLVKGIQEAKEQLLEERRYTETSCDWDEPPKRNPNFRLEDVLGDNIPWRRKAE